MATIFDDVDFQKLSPNEQHAALSAVSPSFRSLPEDQQWAFLNENTGRPAPSVSGAIGAGIREGVASAFDTIPANVAMIARKGLESLPDVARNSAVEGALRNIEDLYRSRGEQTMQEASSQRGRTAVQKIAEGIAATPPNLAEAIATGGSIPALAALGAVGSADQGVKAAARSAVTNAVLGKGIEMASGLPWYVRGPAIGAATYAMSPEQDRVRAFTDALTMGGLAALGSEKTPASDELSRMADDTRREVGLPAPPASEEPKPPEIPSRLRPQYGMPGQPPMRQPEAPVTLPTFPGRPPQAIEMKPEDRPVVTTPMFGGPEASPEGGPELPVADMARRVVEAAPATNEVAPQGETTLDRPDLAARGYAGLPGPLRGEEALRGAAEGAGREVQSLAERPAGDAGSELVRPELPPVDRELAKPVERARGELTRGAEPATPEGVDLARTPEGLPYKPLPGLPYAGPDYRGFRDVASLPPETPLPKKIADAGKIIQQLTKALRAPVQQGSMGELAREPGTPGYARTNLSRFSKDFREKALGTARVKDWADLNATTHELFHLLDQRYPELSRWYDWRSDGKTAPDTPAREQINALAYDVRKPYEGAAEFARLWFTQKDYLARVAPDALREFEQRAPRIFGNKTWSAMQKAQSAMHTAFEQGGVASTLAKYNPPNRGGAPLSTAIDANRQVSVDVRHGILIAERDIKGKDQAGLPNGVWARWQQLAHIPQLKAKMESSGAPVLGADGRISFSGKGLFDILVPVAKQGKATLRKFAAYVLGRQSDIIKKAGMEVPLSDGEIADSMALAKAHPEFEQVYGELASYRERVLQFAIDSGLIGADAASRYRFRGEMAMSMYRQFLTPRGIGTPGLRQGPGVFGMKGSTRPVKDMLENLVEGPYRLLEDSIVNLEKRHLYENLLSKPGGGRWAERIPMERLHPGTGEPTYSILTSPAPYDPENHIMSYRVDGKPVYVELFDPVLAQSVSMIHPRQANLLLRGVLLIPRKFQQALITVSPDFILRQLPRDIVAAAMATRIGSQSPGMAPVTAMQSIARSMRGYVEVLRKGPMWQEYEANLGGGGELRARSQRFREAEVLRYARTKDGRQSVLMDLMNPANYWRAMNAVGRMIEQGPRVGEFMAARAAGHDPRTAGFMASEITTNFSQQGSATPVPGFGWSNAALAEFTHLMVTGAPFYRAMVASADRMYRANLRDPNWKAATATRFALLTGLSAVHYLWARDQDWYKHQDDWNKEANWIFPPINLGTAEKPFVVQPTIPKNYDVGMIANFVERSLEELFKKATDRSSYQFAMDVKNIFLKNFGVSAPTLLGLYMEQETNANALTGAPIETESAKNLEPWARTSPRVPRVLEDLGAATRGLPRDLQLSPSRANAFVSSLLGSTGRYGLMLLDSTLHREDGVALHLDDFPALRVMLQRPDKYTKTASDFYDFVQAATEAQDTRKALFKEHQDQFQAEYDANPVAAMGSYADRVKRAASDIRAQIEDVERDPALSRTERRDNVDRMKAELEHFMRETLETAREGGYRK